MNKMKNKMKKIGSTATLMLVGTIASAQSTGAAGGASAITHAQNTLASQYVPAIGNLLMAIGAIIGLVGAIKVYMAWNQGERDLNKQIISWGGSCVFLVLVGTIISSFFGVTV